MQFFFRQLERPLENRLYIKMHKSERSQMAGAATSNAFVDIFRTYFSPQKLNSQLYFNYLQNLGTNLAGVGVPAGRAKKAQKYWRHANCWIPMRKRRFSGAFFSERLAATRRRLLRQIDATP